MSIVGGVNNGSFFCYIPAPNANVGFTLCRLEERIMTFKYWGVFAFIIIYYLIWWKLTDKRRISDLLLFGSFFAVLRAIVDLAGVTSGLWLYKVRILPLPTSIFLYTLTIAPLTFMLAMQYSRSWKQFFVWGAVAAGFIHFIMIPIFTMIGIFQAMNWNRVYGFLVSYFGALFCRAAFHLVKQVQSKAVNGYDSPLQSTLMQPAYKQFDKEDNKEK